MVASSSGELFTSVEATLIAQWHAWQIPYSDLDGVNLNAVQKLYLGVGSPESAGAGLFFVDDIWIGHPASAEPIAE